MPGAIYWKCSTYETYLSAPSLNMNEYQINFPMKDYCDFTVYKQIFILY